MSVIGDLGKIVPKSFIEICILRHKTKFHIPNSYNPLFVAIQETQIQSAPWPN